MRRRTSSSSSVLYYKLSRTVWHLMWLERGCFWNRRRKQLHFIAHNCMFWTDNERLRYFWEYFGRFRRLQTGIRLRFSQYQLLLTEEGVTEANKSQYEWREGRRRMENFPNLDEHYSSWTKTSDGEKVEHKRTWQVNDETYKKLIYSSSSRIDLLCQRRRKCHVWITRYTTK